MNKVNLADDAPHPNSFFLSFLFKNLLNYAFTHRDKCNQFFKVAENIFTNSKEEDLVASGINFKDLVNNLAEHFLTLDSFETQHTDQDYLLQGLLEFLELMLKKRPQIRDELLLKSKNDLLKELMHSCLFEIPTAVYVSFKIPPPKCKSPESRRAAFQLLQVFISGMNEITKQTIDYLSSPLLKNFWRGPNSLDWFIVPLTAERAKTGYVGLKNLGCTCYMNSLLQQFFMISEFRDTILEIEDSSPSTNPPIAKHENLLYQLKLVFGSLKISQRQYYDPRLFCYSYKDYEGNPINVLEQMDVDEFFNNIMDKLEGLIKTNKNSGIIKRVFGGVLSNELICKGCPHYR
jgi:ubiquitin carboxyl-terminal hydrolase 9/24